MKLEEGMYVRTETGIAKITDIICGQDVKFDNDNIFENDGLKQHHRYDGISTGDYFFKHDVIKISNNIIDLIEEGDYVNGYEVVDVLKNFKVLVDKLELCTQTGNYYLKSFSSNQIKDIVTKEQFESMKYEVK